MTTETEFMIGQSPAMQNVLKLAQQVANATANVLIRGECGSGKEMLAHAIHQWGLRKEKPFIAIDCTALPEAVLESELFGHTKGAFTGAMQNKRGLLEAAQGGTLFLDEIGSIDMEMQTKLLHVLQDKKIRAVGDNEYRQIDVRFISSTQKDLAQAVKEGSFRDDLYYRLSVIPLNIPPLRQRKEDIPLLAQHFLKKYAAVDNSPVQRFTPAALERLMGLHWEGNVRELENMVERLVVLGQKEVIDVDDLSVMEMQTPEDFYSSSVSDMPTIAELEQRYIQYVLGKTGGRKEKASQILGINRRTLYRKERLF